MAKSIVALLLLALAVCGASADKTRINSRKLLDSGAFC
jgi:hypothetical protein